jgi:hypothetical protein
MLPAFTLARRLDVADAVGGDRAGGHSEVPQQYLGQALLDFQPRRHGSSTDGTKGNRAPHRRFSLGHGQRAG